MKKILKFVMDVRRPQVDMPKGAVAISVGYQPDRMAASEVAIWAECEDTFELETRHFQVYGTGHDMTPVPQRHIGSAICGAFVWHVYEVA